MTLQLWGEEGRHSSQQEEEEELGARGDHVHGQGQMSSAWKRLQMKIWGFVLAFAFVMERQIYSPRFCFVFAFVMNMLGTHKPQQQATITKKNNSQRVIFVFVFVIQQTRNLKSRDFYLFLLVSVSVRMVCTWGARGCPGTCDETGSRRCTLRCRLS